MEARTSLDFDKVRAEIDKTKAETRKIMRETIFMPMMVGAAIMAGATGLVGAIVAVVVAILKH